MQLDDEKERIKEIRNIAVALNQIMRPGESIEILISVGSVIVSDANKRYEIISIYKPTIKTNCVLRVG